MSAIVLNPRDNVAVTLADIPAETKLRIKRGPESIELEALEDVPKGHKISLDRIERRSSIVKYGQPIGFATRDIRRGEHVHVHNVASYRRRRKGL